MNSRKAFIYLALSIYLGRWERRTTYLLGFVGMGWISRLMDRWTDNSRGDVDYKMSFLPFPSAQSFIHCQGLVNGNNLFEAIPAFSIFYLESKVYIRIDTKLPWISSHYTMYKAVILRLLVSLYILISHPSPTLLMGVT